MSLLLRCAARIGGRGPLTQTLPALSSCISSELASCGTSGVSDRESGRRASLVHLVFQPWTQVRGFSEELRVVSTSLSEDEFHHVADHTLEGMVEKLEMYVEENNVDGGDVEFSQGVLNVKLGELGTFVMNKQTPNRQIWLSSPVSGPFRFDYSDGRWLYSRDRRDLVRQLEEEIGSLVGVKLQLE